MQNYLKYIRTKRVVPFYVFLSTNVLQGSVGTCVNYGRIFIDYFTANLLQSVMVKNFENRLEFRGVTGKNKVAPFFRTRCRVLFST